jgi:hypothetical protein
VFAGLCLPLLATNASRINAEGTVAGTVYVPGAPWGFLRDRQGKVTTFTVEQSTPAHVFGTTASAIKLIEMAMLLGTGTGIRKADLSAASSARKTAP